MIGIGFCKKPHGIKGELKVQIDEEYRDDFLRAKVIFMHISGREVPYFIENIRTGNHVLMKLEDIDTPEAAIALAGKEMFLRHEDVSTIENEEEAGYEELIGYQLIDTKIGSVGAIADVVEFPQQMMAVVYYQEREVLIPLSEHLIAAIDDEKQTITMELPDGLLDL